MRPELEYCPICGPGNGLHEFEPNRHGCEKCKRVWTVNDEGDVMSEPRLVSIKKTPEVGDAMEDIIEPK